MRMAIAMEIVTLTRPRSIKRYHSFLFLGIDTENALASLLASIRSLLCWIAGLLANRFAKV